MRHWEQGLPPPAAPPVHGRTPQAWLHLFLLCHRPAGAAWQRSEWPDGQPLLEQSWPLVQVLDTLRDELERVGAERRRRAGAAALAGRH